MGIPITRNAKIIQGVMTPLAKMDLDYARGRHTACARPFLIFPRGVSQGWSRLESSTPGERTESQQVTARS